MYIHRHLQAALEQAERMFGAVMVTGPRQAGKTTLLRAVKPGLPYVTLDDPFLLTMARETPGTFFRVHPPPVVVDKIQYAPQLFPHIKMMLDANPAKGQFHLSGSQQFHMMQKVGESLAGRAGILNLHALSLRESLGDGFDWPFLPDENYRNRRRESARSLDAREAWRRIHRGAMPAMAADPAADWQMYHAAYVKTYLERDIRDLAQVGDELVFFRFLTAAAARTGQLLNLAALARDVGIGHRAAERWLSILRASNLVFLLPPYHANATKRSVKTPKLYFLDTGLAAYLTSWTSAEALQSGAMAGAFFETYVVAEIVKSYANAGFQDPPLHFYRDRGQNEIDVLIEANGALHPVEIKKHADPSRKDIGAFGLLDGLPGVRRGPGALICLYGQPAPLAGADWTMPLSWI